MVTSQPLLSKEEVSSAVVLIDPNGRVTINIKALEESTGIEVKEVLINNALIDIAQTIKPAKG